MDHQEFLKQYFPIIKKNLFPIALGLFGLIFLGYGLIVLVGPIDSSKEIIFEAGSDSSLPLESTSNQNKAPNIVVDVEGAVLRPGVYHVGSDFRLADALIASGGLSSDADRDWVAKRVNLAAKLTDGAKIYIPRIGEDVKSITGGTGTTGITGNERSFSQININTTSEEILDSLPGIGPVTAQKIINGRPYRAIDELLSKKSVGSKVFDQIREKITVY